jgi:hypothetical protein
MEEQIFWGKDLPKLPLKLNSRLCIYSKYPNLSTGRIQERADQSKLGPGEFPGREEAAWSRLFFFALQFTSVFSLLLKSGSIFPFEL